MTTVDPRVLVVGGASFVDRAFCEALRDRHRVPFVMLDCGALGGEPLPGVPRIACNLDDDEACRGALASTRWTAIVDLVSQQDRYVRRILSNASCEHYTILSSSAVDLAQPGDDYFFVAQQHLWCEHLAQRLTPNVLVVRAGFICGDADPSGRFETADGRWFWRGTRTPVSPMVRVGLLVNMVSRLVRDRRTGLARAGYSLVRER